MQAVVVADILQDLADLPLAELVVAVPVGKAA
jgi:hypothetical protein